METLQLHIRTAEGLQLDAIADILYRRLEHCRTRLEKLRYFADATANLYQGAEAAMDRFDSYVSALEGASYNSSTQAWVLPLSTKKTFNMTEAEFVELMAEQYGFDERTGKLIYKTYKALKKKYPKAGQTELDWRFTRIMGGMYYDGYKWDQTAGDATFIGAENGGSLSIKEYLEWLGMSEKDVNYLYYKVRVQNAITSAGDFPFSMIKDEYVYDYKTNMEKALGRRLTLKEFEKLWNEQNVSMKRKGDFAHQQITMASMLATDTNNVGLGVNIYFLGSDSKRENMAGWLGDATIKIIQENEVNKKPSLKNDDYIADLDAENIIHIMRTEDTSYFKAQEQYYKEVGTKYTRAEMFLKNTPYKKVQTAIFQELYPDFVCTNEQIKKCMKDTKEEYPDTYNFLKSLEAKSNKLLEEQE